MFSLPFKIKVIPNRKPKIRGQPTGEKGTSFEKYVLDVAFAVAYLLHKKGLIKSKEIKELFSNPQKEDIEVGKFMKDTMPENSECDCQNCRGEKGEITKEDRLKMLKKLEDVLKPAKTNPLKTLKIPNYEIQEI